MPPEKFASEANQAAVKSTGRTTKFSALQTKTTTRKTGSIDMDTPTPLDIEPRSKRRKLNPVVPDAPGPEPEATASPPTDQDYRRWQVGERVSAELDLDLRSDSTKPYPLWSSKKPRYYRIAGLVSRQSIPPPHAHLEDFEAGQLLALVKAGKLSSGYLHLTWPETFGTKGYLNDRRKPYGRPYVVWNEKKRRYEYALACGVVVLMGSGEFKATHPDLVDTRVVIGGAPWGNYGKHSSVTNWRHHDKDNVLQCSGVKVNWNRIEYPTDIDPTRITPSMLSVLQDAAGAEQGTALHKFAQEVAKLQQEADQAGFKANVANKKGDPDFVWELNPDLSLDHCQSAILSELALSDTVIKYWAKNKNKPTPIPFLQNDTEHSFEPSRFKERDDAYQSSLTQPQSSMYDLEQGQQRTPAALTNSEMYELPSSGRPLFDPAKPSPFWNAQHYAQAQLPVPQFGSSPSTKVSPRETTFPEPTTIQAQPSRFGVPNKTLRVQALDRPTFPNSAVRYTATHPPSSVRTSGQTSSSAISRDLTPPESLSIALTLKPLMASVAKGWSAIVIQLKSTRDLVQRAQDLEESLERTIREYITMCADNGTSLEDLDLAFNRSVHLTADTAAALQQLLREPESNDDIALSIRKLFRPTTEAGISTAVIALPKYRKPTIEDKIAELEHHAEMVEYNKDPAVYEQKIMQGNLEAALDFGARRAQYKAQVEELRREDAERQETD